MGSRTAPARGARAQLCPGWPAPSPRPRPPLSLACALSPEDAEQEDWEDQAGKARPLAARGACAVRTDPGREARPPARVRLEGSRCLWLGRLPTRPSSSSDAGASEGRALLLRAASAAGLSSVLSFTPPHMDTRGSAGTSGGGQEDVSSTRAPSLSLVSAPKAWHPWAPSPLLSAPPALSPAPILLLRSHRESCGPRWGQVPGPWWVGGRVHCGGGPGQGRGDRRAALSPGLPSPLSPRRCPADQRRSRDPGECGAGPGWTPGGRGEPVRPRGRAQMGLRSLLGPVDPNPPGAAATPLLLNSGSWILGEARPGNGVTGAVVHSSGWGSHLPWGFTPGTGRDGLWRPSPCPDHAE